MPTLAPTPAGLPTSADAARALLPGVRIAARERYGRVRAMLFAPFLLVLLQIFGEFLMQWLSEWLDKQTQSHVHALPMLASRWADDRSPEVRVAMVRVAQGDTGE